MERIEFDYQDKPNEKSIFGVFCQSNLRFGIKTQQKTFPYTLSKKLTNTLINEMQLGFLRKAGAFFKNQPDHFHILGISVYKVCDATILSIKKIH